MTKTKKTTKSKHNRLPLKADPAIQLNPAVDAVSAGVVRLSAKTIQTVSNNTNLQTLGDLDRAAPPITDAKVVLTAQPAPAITVKDHVLAVFKAEPDREFRTDDVVNAVLARLPKAKRDNILWQISNLKKDGLVHRVRNDGHSHILRFGPGAVVQVPVVSVQQTQIASPAPRGSALGDFIVKLSAAIEQREKLDLTIAQLKASITEAVASV